MQKCFRESIGILTQILKFISKIMNKVKINKWSIKQ